MKDKIVSKKGGMTGELLNNLASSEKLKKNENIILIDFIKNHNE